MPKTAVVLLNLGGPDSLDAVEPFLYKLFSDPYIISIPLGFIFQKPLARYIAKRRSQNVREQITKIGGKSPINEWTEKQRVLLQDKLREKHSSIDVFVAMRYWHPLTEETVKKIVCKNYAKILLMPLYPHYSKTTTGSSFAEWERVYTGNSENVVKIDSFYNNVTYVAALNHRIEGSTRKFPESIRDDVHFLFSAHGIPVNLVKQGDPYKDQIEATVKAVMEQRKHDHGYNLCFQSKAGPGKWLEPAADTVITELSKSGRKHLLVIPISFVSDHFETLFELDVEYRRIADEAGIEHYTVMEGLNDSELFIKALMEIVSEKL